MKKGFIYTLMAIVISYLGMEHVSAGFSPVKAKIYYIDPNVGSDDNPGTVRSSPWRSFVRLNKVLLNAGDEVRILSAGAFHQTLALRARGTAEKPVRVVFAPGRYDFFPDGMLKEQLHISNTNNRPDELKAIAIKIDSCSSVRLSGKGAKFMMRGKVIETYINRSSDIQLEGMGFDYFRPTVSELTVGEVSSGSAELLVHWDSQYEVVDGKLIWIGEGWRHRAGYYWQVYDPLTGRVKRKDFKMETFRFEDMGRGKLKAYFTADPGFEKDKVYQSRDIVRDCAGMFFQYSRDIVLKDVNLYYMHGMGIVSQLCENILVDGISVRPDPDSGRTCSAWADILHFSLCRGRIEVKNSYLSAANDDAINIHGVHLKVVEVMGSRELKVAYMHHETFGFDPYLPGDSIDFVKVKTLMPFGAAKVVSSKMLSDKEVVLSFSGELPAQLKVGDVLENVSATPEIWIHGNTIASIPTRGILVSSRRKTVIEDNRVLGTHMSGLLIGDDAAYWYESGMVRDVVVKNNKLLRCGEPAVLIHPENTVQAKVHSGISLLGNKFELSGRKMLAVKGTSGLKVIGNRISISSRPNGLPKIEELVELTDCANVEIRNNRINDR